MLRTLQWIYKLGVQNERKRIAAHLSEEKHIRRQSMEGYMFDAQNETKEHRKKRLYIQAEMDESVIAIIDSILAPSTSYEIGSSIMYPKEEK